MLLRRVLPILLGTCALVAPALPAQALEAHAAVVNVWYRLGDWPCPSGCSGSYQTDDWFRISITGVSGAPSLDGDTWYDSGSSMYVSTTNCAVDHVSAHFENTSGSNAGTLDVILTRIGTTLSGWAYFTSYSGLGSGTYDVEVPVVTPEVDVPFADACLAGPHTDNSWSGDGTMDSETL